MLQPRALLGLLLLLLLVVASAEETETQASIQRKKTHSRPGHHKGKHYKNITQGHFYPRQPQSKPSPRPSPPPRPRPPPPPGPPPGPPVCNCKTFPEFRTRAGSCVNCTLGIPAIFNGTNATTTCRSNATSWCKPVNSRWSCTYPYRPASFCCSHEDGPCDRADYCSGFSPQCPDRVASSGRLCRPSEGVCVKPSRCDGVLHQCPPKRLVKNGRPCSEHPGAEGLYLEAFESTSQSTAAVASLELSDEEAAERGWITCNRCFDGECLAFEWSWMQSKKRRHNKHHPHASDEGDGDEGSGENASTAAHHKGPHFSPRMFCKKDTRHAYEEDEHYD